ncbi:MAG: acylneuraminate cytidylyltransferase [Chloroflexota bacterium]|nr:acylneuraminate cytidylyltransferase [Chloroflexota bacterium]
MVNKPEVLAIIPARGGSKGIPRKNIRDFSGYSLIAYSIAAGLQAELISRVIVSTEDLEIADVARTFGAEVPFMRPVELAQDDTTDLPVFEHALRWLDQNEDYHPDLVVQLRPTSPIRPKDLVDRAVEQLLHHPEVDSVRGVVQAGQNPHKMWRIDPQGLMRPLLKVDGMDEPYNAPRQKLPPVFWQTGHIEVIRPEVITRKNSMTGDAILPIFIDPAFTVDLDNLRDWAYFEQVAREGDLDMIHPGHTPRPWPEKISLIVFDFDGVMTDNRVWVDQSGVESVAAHRGDGTGIEMLLEAGFKGVIISSEPNPVVAARARKIGLPYFHGVGDKAQTLSAYLEETGINPEETIYVGNDVNDLPCFEIAACAVVVSDAHPDVRRKADQMLTRPGGYGAVREVCDLILARYR